MKVAGFNSGHDCAYAVLDNGIPIIHAELERYIRIKEPPGDSIQFLFDTYPEAEEIVHFAHWSETNPNWAIRNKYPESFKKALQTTSKNGGSFYEPGHHLCHAANALFSSNYKDALVITIDGGGRDIIDDQSLIGTFTAWKGDDLDFELLAYLQEHEINIGTMWSQCTSQIFGLSSGYPKGNQCGSVMAMACMGDASKYYDEFYNHRFKHPSMRPFNFGKFKEIAEASEQGAFDVAAALQRATETVVKEILDPLVENSDSDNICLSGGVVLNSVMTGKLAKDWYPDKNIYVCPVPYDAGLAIGAAQYVWHTMLRNERIQWEDNCTPYLGVTHSEESIVATLNSRTADVFWHRADVDAIVDKLDQGFIVSVFSQGSESGRRALGNRSILADPRNPDMKDIINEKVKHRQWYRPFAPSIIREEVKNWFTTDQSSPYMSFVLDFTEEAAEKVPAVAHFDNSARLQTVTEKDNAWYYNFLKKWQEKSGVPIILNTSFNDREPIVENPDHAVNCFLKTDIDFLFFCDYNILVKKNK